MDDFGSGDVLNQLENENELAFEGSGHGETFIVLICLQRSIGRH